MAGRKALVVLAMHLGETSALARVLSLRGASLPAHLITRNQGSASGRREPSPVAALSDELLDYFGTAWDDPFAIFHIPDPHLFPERFQQRAARVIEDQYGDSGLFILDDPQVSLLSGFWLDALARMDVHACPIVLVRSFAEVAAALPAHDKPDLLSATLSYLAYCVEIATAYPDRAPSFLRYDQLLVDWRGSTDRIATEQGLQWPRSSALNEAEVDDFLKPGSGPATTLHLSPVQSWTDTAWEWMTARSEGKAPPIEPLLEIRNQLAASAQSFPPRCAINRQSRVAAQASQASQDALRAQLASQASRAKHVQRELESTRVELRRAQDANAQLRSSHSWRITAPLRNLITVIRKFLDVSRQTLRRPKNPRVLAPPNAGNGPAALAPAVTHVRPEPPYARRRHRSLRAFLVAEFGDAAAAEMLLRIDRFRLPVETGQGRPASTMACSVDEAIDWAAAIARRASEHVGSEPYDPDVSIVVPVYNQVQFTLACVDALLSHATRYRFEILVGDDASTDATAQAFANPIPCVRFFRNASNLGFVRNCNAAAATARGRYVVMLNNDALVLPGWLDELIGVLEGNTAVGLVGSKLIYPDGRLQECGAIVWRDGSAWNFGRLDDPRRPEHNYLRDVDFVSGASIALPIELWKKLGGFDQHFAPAYAEDADLAFRIRAEGLHTLVQPLSQALHFEGVSSGTDLGQGAKAYQAENLRKLYERWKDVLLSHRENAQQPELEKERDISRRMLFIDRSTLTPNEDAGSLVAFEILNTFRHFGFKVTFIPEDNFAHMGEDTRVLQRLGVETIYRPGYSRMDQFLAARHDPFDVIVLHRFTVGDKHMAALKAQFPGAKFIFLACDLHYLREMREADLAGDAAAINRAKHTMRRELAVASASNAVVVYSEFERDLVQAEIPSSNVVLFPLVHDPVKDPMPLAARDGVCFVGGGRHPPNADAILWFANEVWPLVHSRCPATMLFVAGSHMTESVKALGSRPGIEIAGFVPDMESFLAQRRVNVAPMRFGAGAKGKVAASLANGLPTVGTSIAAEGMLLSPGENILVADTAVDFANCVIELLTDDARWNEISRAGLRYAAEVTSRVSAQERIRVMLEDLRLME